MQEICLHVYVSVHFQTVGVLPVEAPVPTPRVTWTGIMHPCMRESTARCTYIIKVGERGQSLTLLHDKYVFISHSQPSLSIPLNAIMKATLLSISAALMALAYAQCPDYSDYSQQYHPPFSSGQYNLSYQRPIPACRTFNSSVVENAINSTLAAIADPDLARLFLNAYPNTLDTAVKWRGYAANNSAEELAFVITGDINAMWLRDSANQMQSYRSLLTASSSPDSLASLYRGVINLQARYILTSPYCNSFQAPVESGLAPENNAGQDTVFPTYDKNIVYECKFELDSLAAFLEVSTDYYTATNDLSFFGNFSWVQAVEQIMTIAEAMMTPTYSPNGQVNASPYTFVTVTTRASETLLNNGLGSPTMNGTGLIRSAYRPSDDSCIYQLFIPANMMLSTYLASTSQIMAQLGDNSDLANRMSSLASSLRAAISDWGIVSSRVNGDIYAYEVDGYGSQNIMDDANIPSLLSAPFFGYLDANDSVYQNTRKQILSPNTNPYFMTGPVINSIGGPHDGPGGFTHAEI